MAVYDVNGNVVSTDGGGDSTDHEAVARQKLTGKVLIAIGDSYTAGMSTQYSAFASKYGMIIDNRGVVSATISHRDTQTYRRMPDIVDTIVSDYASGYTINGTTYNADSVALITFMGGANDGAGIENWIGTGIHETANTTIYGALNQIFNLLRATFKKAEVIAITQPTNFATLKSSISTDAQAQELGFDDLAESQVMTDYQFSNYLHAIKEYAVRNSVWPYGVHLIDEFHNFPTVFNADNRSEYWQNDKLHLTANGYNLVATAIDKKIIEVFG